MAIKFEATIEIRGINPFVLVDEARAKEVEPGWRKPMPVLVRLNDVPADGHRINMMPTGDGSFYLYLNGIVRDAAGVAVGDRVSVEIEFDQGYRNGPQHPMPDWFAEALAANPAAVENWAKLTPSRQKEVLRYLANLKSPEARHRNLVRALGALSGSAARFMARDWSGGS